MSSSSSIASRSEKRRIIRPSGAGRAGADKHFQIPSAGYEDAAECGAMIQGHRNRHHPSVVDRRQSELVKKAAAEIRIVFCQQLA